MSKLYKTLTKKRLLEMKPFLDQLNDKVESPDYIYSDPVSFLHAFIEPKDQLIAGFFAAIMAWGRRDTVLAKVSDLLDRMDHQPFDFVINFDESRAQRLHGFKHRTFTDTDVYWLIRILQKIHRDFGSFEAFWHHCYQKSKLLEVHFMDVFHEEFFNTIPETPQRTRKHIADKRKKSTCKRLFLFLRWTVRDNSPVDLGLMNTIPKSELRIPFDVHVARQARILGLLGRKQNDWTALDELHNRLLLLDPTDPARYDYALFGIGVLKIQIPEEFVINKNVEG
jgi:uncharacterized protein (TIGR02757 family)